MSDGTPLEQAKAFLKAADRHLHRDDDLINPEWEWEPVRVPLTFGTLHALVAQIELDEKRETELRRQLETAGKALQKGALDVTDPVREIAGLRAELESVAAERDRLAAENAQMRETIKTVVQYLRPLWGTLIKLIVPLWNQLEPLLEPDTETGPEPSHGESGVCAVCHGEIEYFEEARQVPGGGVETLNSWWSHRVHPDDGHDAVPGVHETDPEPEPKLGDHGTCAYLVGRGAEGSAPCGYEIVLHEERAPELPYDSMYDPPHPHVPHFIRVWRHTDSKIDGMHKAVLGGPA